MERILVLIDPSGPERQTMEFACYLANLTQSKLTGIFLNPQLYAKEARIAWYDIRRNEGMPTAELRNVQARLDETKLAFTRFCDNHQLLCKPDTIVVERLEDVYVQSRFADLLVLTPNYSARPEESTLSGANVLHILKHAECPIFVAPLTSKQPSEIVFAYDGSASSVYAIKQFTHLFPQLKDLKTTFLEVTADGTHPIDFKETITAYLSAHYPNINHLVLVGKPEDELFSYFLDKKEMYVVMGSFGKSFVQSIFHRSTANLLLKTTALPVFISHK